jgi:Leucine-rich repeat (LRR) protein
MVVHGLKTDSTYYFAIRACDEANNCAGPSNCVSATCFTDMVVIFPDTNLESVIRTQISKPSGDIYRSDLMTILQINANSRGISSLSGLEYCLALIEILMADNTVSDLAPVANLVKLRSLQLFHNDINSITSIGGLVNLEKLTLGNNSISDISALLGLTKLHEVRLENNDIINISPLVDNSGIAAGDSVYLNGNPLSDQSINDYIPVLEARGVTVWH